MDVEVAIVGAGPVGLVLALDLARQGVSCALIEKKAQPEFWPKMERCNARTMEFFRRMGLSDKIRAAGLAADVSMDVFIVTRMDEKPLVHLPYDSVAAAQEALAKVEDTSQPAEAYQLISQYTLEPLLKAECETRPEIAVLYDHGFEGFVEDPAGVTVQTRRGDGTPVEIRAKYLVGCDGGRSDVRKQLGIALRGEAGILKLRQALYRCDSLFDMLPMGDGPGQGRHYHVADNQSSFLIMQDSTKHWTLHAVVEDDAAMATQFEKVVGRPVDYEMLYVAEWRQNLLLADRYRAGRVFLAGDAVHLVIPTGGLGMNTGVGDAIDLSWKLAAVLRGWGGPKLLDSYEVERRQIGDQNVGASRYASLGRRKWRGQWQQGFNDQTEDGQAKRDNLARVAEVEQRKTNEMIGAELGYRYIDSPVIWDEPGGPDFHFREYNPMAWTGVRLPHCWLAPGKSIHDVIGTDGFTLIRLRGDGAGTAALARALAEKGAPFATLDLMDDRLRGLYGTDLILVRPDLHIVWRGNALPTDMAALTDVVTGRPVAGMGLHHL